MNTVTVKHTYEKNSYDLEVKWDIFNYNDLTLNINQVRKWCMEGCSNYNTNGGCPPFSPTADNLLKNKDFILLMCKIKTCQTYASSAEEKVELIQNILYSFMNFLGYKIYKKYNIKFLNAGKCSGCNTCTIHSGCKNPEKRVYCLTGLGIMLGDVIEKLFHEKLQWYTGDEQPDQIIKIMGFMSEERSSSLTKDLNSILKEGSI